MGQNANIIKRNDELVSQIVKARDPMCKLRLTGCTHYTDDPAHCWGRGSMSVRWNLDNVHGACRNCHSHADTHPKEKMFIFREILGKKKYNELKELSRQNFKLLPSELKEINLSLKNIKNGQS